MVKAVREVEKALEEVFTKENIYFIRLDYGFLSKYLKDILSKCATKNIKKGTLLS